MEFQDVLARRRMVRNYLPDPVEPNTLRRIAAAALRAPSAGNSQGFSIVVVTSEDTRKKIADLADEPAYVEAGFDPWISRAPAHIVLSVSEQTYHDRYNEPDKLEEAGQEIAWPIPYWWVDAGAATMAVLLTAVDEGLSAGLLGVHSIPSLKELLGIPSHFEPIGVITVGHPAPDRRSASLARGKKPLEATIHWEFYGSER